MLKFNYTILLFEYILLFYKIYWKCEIDGYNGRCWAFGLKSPVLVQKEHCHLPNLERKQILMNEELT